MSEASEKFSKKDRQSSFFKRVRRSFVRSGGDRGADVKTLRGTRGADFEDKARISRGGAGVGCGCFGGDESNKERHILIKGPSCFVFSHEIAPSPKYAISLLGMKTSVKSTVVYLENALGDVQYELTFESAEVAERFSDVVKAQASAAETEEVRKRLGHGNLIHKRASQRHADTVAKAKVKDQPDKPISAEDVMENMVVTPM